MAADEIELIDSAPGVGRVGIEPHANAAQVIIGIDRAQDVASVVAREE